MMTWDEEEDRSIRGRKLSGVIDYHSVIKVLGLLWK